MEDLSLFDFRSILMHDAGAQFPTVPAGYKRLGVSDGVVGLYDSNNQFVSLPTLAQAAQFRMSFFDDEPVYFELVCKQADGEPVDLDSLGYLGVEAYLYLRGGDGTPTDLNAIMTDPELGLIVCDRAQIQVAGLYDFAVNLVDDVRRLTLFRGVLEIKPQA